MSSNEIIQWTIVGVIVLVAIIWTAVKVSRIGSPKNSGCDSCAGSPGCKAKELKNEIQRREGCRDGQSARN